MATTAVSPPVRPAAAHPEGAMLVGRALRRSVSAEDLALYQRTNAEVRRLKADLAADRYELGQRLNLIAERALYRAGGYATLEQYLEHEVEVARSTAYVAMRVVRTFSLDAARKFGMDKLEAILEYVEATPAEEKVEEILALRIRARTPAGRPVEKPIAQASLREIQAATQAVRERRAHRRQSRWPPEVRKLVRGLAQRLKKEPGIGTVGIHVEVPSAGRRAGKAYVTFQRVPIESLGAFKQILHDQLGSKD